MQTLLVAQPLDVHLGKPDPHVGRLVVVAPTEDLAMPINPRQRLTIRQWDVQPDGADFGLEPAIDQR